MTASHVDFHAGGGDGGLLSHIGIDREVAVTIVEEARILEEIEPTSEDEAVLRIGGRDLADLIERALKSPSTSVPLLPHISLALAVCFDEISERGPLPAQVEHLRGVVEARVSRTSAR